MLRTLAAGVFLLIAGSAAAAPQALVLGNGGYTSMPALSACTTSAHAVAAALHRLDASVVEQVDGTFGAVDAALTRFSQALAAAPGQPAVIYVCGYATALNDRPFLLPVSANLARPQDVLSQGILLKSLLDTLVRAKAGPALVAIDAVAAPGAPAGGGLASLAQVPAATGTGLIATLSPAATQPTTPLATALIAALKASPPETAAVLATVRQQLQGAPQVQVAALREPAASGSLVPAPPPAVQATAPPQPAPAGPVPAAPAPAATTAAAPPAAPAAAPLPDEAQMTDAQRRQVQSALTRLGYYDAQPDGVFGPETRAAIRRWQHELHAPMTGHLTASEATHLVNR